MFTAEDRKLDQELQLKKIKSEARRFIWSTPLVAALAGLLTLSATFVFDRLRGVEETTNTITIQEVKTELEASEARLKQQLDERSAESEAERSARAEERQFQYKIVEQLLLETDLLEVDRARTLLFLARAGVLTELNTDELSRMAEATIIEAGQDPDQIGIPVLPRVTTNRTIEKIILGAEANLPLATIRSYHLSLGWRDVGMHYFVDREGNVQTGRSIDETPAFALGSNEGAIAVALACDVWTDFEIEPETGCEFTSAQVHRAKLLVDNLKKEHGLGAHAVFSRGVLRAEVHNPLVLPILDEIRGQ